MQAKQLFGVIVRTVGLGMTLWGLYSVVYGLFGTMLGLTFKASVAATVLFGAFFLVIGLVLLSCAADVIRFTYGHEDHPETKDKDL